MAAMMDRKTKEAIDRHIEGPPWGREEEVMPQGIDAEADADMYALGAEVTQTIAFAFSDSKGLTLLDLEILIDRAKYLGPNARVTVDISPSDRPGSLGITTIKVTGP